MAKPTKSCVPRGYRTVLIVGTIDNAVDPTHTRNQSANIAE